MTDNEIIKALESVGTSTGVALGHHSGKADLIADRFRELLEENNRQKAEIERLQRDIKFLQDEYIPEIGRALKNLNGTTMDLMLENARLQQTKFEAIKEFAEQLKKKFMHKGKSIKYGDFTWDDITSYELDNLVDNLIKEWRTKKPIQRSEK